MSGVSISWAQQGASPNVTIELEWQGRRLEGMPLSWAEDQLFLLQRDGLIRSVDPTEAQNYHKTSDSFQSYSQSELKASLLREFGKGFDVSGTGHFLVVHPGGQRDPWSSRFEDLYRSFVRYLSVRGYQPQAPSFPLVAIVFPQREGFLRYARVENVQLAGGMLGYYSPVTNRIVMFDITQGDGEDPDWQVNATTVIHEAAHQTAFNVGLHNRFNLPPRWVAEGLGTLFEAPGVYDAQRNTSRHDRVNRRQLAAFRAYLSRGRQSTSLAELISSDRTFASRTDEAYAEAWALTFYLTETESRKYMQYLAKTAARERFRELRSPEVLQEFTSVFGEDWSMLDARFLRFMQEIK